MANLTAETVTCNCAAVPPTMPTYRTKHLLSCPVWVFENAANVIGRVTEPVTVSTKQPLIADQHAAAVEAVEQIIHDIRDRSGLGNEWDEIDEETQDIIRDEWKKIILAEFGNG